MITETQMSKEDMERVVDTGQNCLECGANLTIAWGGHYGHQCFILRCANDIHHQGIKRDFELTPANMPVFLLYDAKKGRRLKMEKEHGKEKINALAKYQNVAVINRETATEIVETLWKGAPTQEKMKAIMLCSTYNLNPLMNHLFMLPFKDKDGGKNWVTVLGIEATRLMAHRKHNFTYLDMTPRSATPEELKQILGKYVDDSAVYQITKIKDLDTGAEAYGLGSWKGTVYGTDKGNTASNMAAIRSERQALKRLYPAEIPANVEVIDESFIEGDYRMVDEETGEIKDDNAEIKPPEKSEAQKEDAEKSQEEVSEVTPESTESKSEAVKPERDVDAIKTSTDLYKACMIDFPDRFKSSKDVLKILGVESFSELTDKPADLYLAVVAKLNES